jgi:hypothetical protein
MLAVLTGLRANELRSLTREHLDIEQQGVRRDDDWTKNRRPGFQPLPKATVNLLVENFDSGIVQRRCCLYARGNTYHPRALVYVPVKTDRDIALDLEQAKIPKETQKGKIDFHALRTAFVSLTIEAGASAKEAQDLARHSAPRITMNVYARANDQKMAGGGDRVADHVGFGANGVNMVRIQSSDVTKESPKLLSNLGLMNDNGDWRRGESNLRTIIRSCGPIGPLDALFALTRFGAQSICNVAAAI